MQNVKNLMNKLTLIAAVALVTVFGFSNTVHAALVAHSMFDLSGADLTADITGNGNNGILGTVIGADSADPTYECAPANIAPIDSNICSLRFDGNNDRVVIIDDGSDPLLNPSGSITIDFGSRQQTPRSRWTR